MQVLLKEAQRVDREHLRLLMKYVGHVFEVFEMELDGRDRVQADNIDGDGDQFDPTVIRFWELRTRSELPGG